MQRSLLLIVLVALAFFVPRPESRRAGATAFAGAPPASGQHQNPPGPFDFTRMVSEQGQVVRVIPGSIGLDLTSTQRDYFQRCIDRVNTWVDQCCLTSDPGGPPTDLGQYLQGLHNNENIGKEGVPEKTDGATASPSWPDLPAVFPDGSAPYSFNPTTGINLGAAVLPPDNATSLPEGDALNQQIASVASVLVHETSHLLNPTPLPTTLRDMERSAYEHTNTALCDLLGCSDLSIAEKNGICTFIKKANVAACKMFDHQWVCSGCAAPPIGIDTDAGCENLSGSQPSTYPPVSRPYSGADLRGAIDLEPTANAVTVDLFRWSTGSFVTRVVPVSVPQESAFQAVSLALPSEAPSYVYLGGYDTVTGEGMIVRGDLDLSVDPPFAFSTVFKGSGFTVPLSISVVLSSPNQIIVLDAPTAKVVRCNTVSDQCSTLATPAEAPLLPMMRGLVWIQCRDTAGNPSGSAVSVVEGSDALLMQTALPYNSVLLLDDDGDGTIDRITQA